MEDGSFHWCGGCGGWKCWCAAAAAAPAAAGDETNTVSECRGVDVMWLLLLLLIMEC